MVTTLVLRLDEEEDAVATPSASPASRPRPPLQPSSPPPPADPDDSPPLAKPTPAPGELRWYGWQVLAADAASAAVIALGGVGKTGTIPWLGTGGAFLASPIVHGFHGRWGATAGSFGMRLGFALVGGAIGYIVSPPCYDQPPSTGGALVCGVQPIAYAIYGGWAGLVLASAVDAVGLSWEHVRVRRTDTSGLRLTPLLRVSRAEGHVGGGTLGVAGAF